MELQDEGQQIGLQLAFIKAQQCQDNAHLMNVFIIKGHQGTGGIGHDNAWAWVIDCTMNNTIC